MFPAVFSDSEPPIHFAEKRILVAEKESQPPK